MRKRLLLPVVFAFGLLMALSLLMASPAAAQGDQPGKVVLGGQFTLESGERLSGDLAVIGGQATIEEGATVDGDAVVLGGMLAISGKIDGDIAVFGGQVTLTSSAVVDGDVVSLGGSVTRSPGAQVSGEVREGEAVEIPGLRNLPIVPGVTVPSVIQPPQPDLQTSPGAWLLHMLLRILRMIAWTLAIVAMALVVALLWPKGVERLGRAGLSQPAMVFLTGFISWILGLALVAILAITLCLLPVAIALALVLVVAALLSWVVTGWVIGRKLLEWLKVGNSSVVLEAVVGTLLLTVVYFLVSVIWCMNFIIGVLVGSFGLGAIVLTRFGTQPYPSAGGGEPPSGVSGPPQVLPPAAPSAGPPAVYSADELGLPPSVTKRDS
jgi:cytoskeletal protein CcmA (bactofilin family)